MQSLGEKFRDVDRYVLQVSVVILKAACVDFCTRKSSQCGRSNPSNHQMFRLVTTRQKRLRNGRRALPSDLFENLSDTYIDAAYLFAERLHRLTKFSSVRQNAILPAYFAAFESLELVVVKDDDVHRIVCSQPRVCRIDGYARDRPRVRHTASTSKGMSQ
jgi:hypothetical protein